MAITSATNTQAEALRKILSDISNIKTFPDADLEFLINLETMILNNIKGQVEQNMGPADGGSSQGLAAMSADPSMPGAMSGMGMGGPSPMDPAGGGFGGGVPGIRNDPGAPNPDELRRMIGG